MRSSRVAVTSILLFVLLTGVVGCFAQVKGQTFGYVQYKVGLGSKENSTFAGSVVVNETVQPTNQAGFIDLTLNLSFDSSKLAYSKVVNSSSLPETFPYLPTLRNQSLTYNYRGYSIAVQINNAGQAGITYNGTLYSGTKYLVSFSATNSSSTNPIAGNGEIVCLPSGLIGTLQLTLNQAVTVNATLLSTDLPLNAASIKINPVGVSLFGVLLVVIVVVVMLLAVRKARQNKRMNQSKPSESHEEKSAGNTEDKDNPSYWADYQKDWVSKALF